MKQTIIKWVMLISFALVILGGLNYLVAGLFAFDTLHFIFGGTEGAFGRVIYVIIGLAAATLLTMVLVKAFKNKKG